MTEDSLTWHCTCGAVEIAVSPPKGTRCVCYCADCQAFLRHLDRTDLFEAASGTDLLQAMADQVEIRKGAKHLACLRLTDKGPLRWYTSCCSTPVCNTGARPLVPLASLLVRGFDDSMAIPPISAHVNRKHATGPISGDPGSTGRLIRSFLTRAAWTVLTGRYRKTPFFNADGTPVAKPLTLSDKDRARAYGG